MSYSMMARYTEHPQSLPLTEQSFHKAGQVIGASKRTCRFEVINLDICFFEPGKTDGALELPLESLVVGLAGPPCGCEGVIDWFPSLGFGAES